MSNHNKKKQIFGTQPKSVMDSIHHAQNKKEKEEHNRFTRRIFILIAIVFFGIIGLLSRLFFLQVSRYDYYRTRSQKNRVRLQTIPPVRGNVFDRYGTPLSENILSFNLVANRSKATDLEQSLKKVSDYIRFDEDDKKQYQQNLKKKRYNEDVVVRADLSEKEMNVFLVHLYQFSGFDIVPSYKRNYPYGELTAHVVGYINNINRRDLDTLDKKEYDGTTVIGRTGIERFYENRLHGKAGYRQAEISRTGKVIRVLSQKNPIPGQDLYLSLDLNLQQILRDELKSSGFDGASVAMDPRNGEVLGLFSNPSFDANLFVSGISHKNYQKLANSPRKNLFNRAINGRYAPASTIKPMVALAGLHHYIITPDVEIECTGSYRIPNYEYTKKFFCWKRTGHGEMNTKSSIVESCDVYYYTIGRELGIENIDNYLSQFGLGKKTGIDLPSESSGILPNKAWKEKKYKQSWFIGDTVNASIGQGYLTTTPLQMAYFTSVLASKGKRFKPHFLTHYKDAETGAQLAIPNYVYDDSAVEQSNPNAWDVIHQSLIDVMYGKTGTGRKIEINLPFKIAGKTGTAQVFSFKSNKRIKKEDLSKKLRDNSVFVAYAPAKEPVIALSVILENAGGGSEVAAPIAVKMLEKYFNSTDEQIFVDQQEADNQKYQPKDYES